MAEFFSGAVETLPPERLRQIQHERLRTQLRRVYETSPFYRRRMDEAGFSRHRALVAEDLAALPVTTKEDVRKALESAPPYGDLLAVPPERVARIHFSSGTTGAPTPMFWTERDLDRWAELYARYLWAQGVRPGDRFQVAYSYSWFVGGLGATAAAQRIGAAVVPAGSVDTERQLDTIERFGVTSIACTPSFALHLAERAEALGRPLPESTVRGVHVGGEPGASLQTTRAAVEAAWGARCYDCYGTLEFQPVAWDCGEQAGPHLAEDAVLAEVLDAETGDPVADGDEGVLVLTHLDREAAPLVRWWTGDSVALDRGVCACGRTHARLRGGVRGRADDMLIVRGVNVFPSAVEEVVRGVPGAGPEFRIVVPVERARLSELQVIAEAASAGVDPAELSSRIADAIRERLSVRAHVEIVPSGSLERATHKANRLVVAEERNP